MVNIIYKKNNITISYILADLVCRRDNAEVLHEMWDNPGKDFPYSKEDAKKVAEYIDNISGEKLKEGLEKLDKEK